MALFFITYDLRGNRNYQKLYDELKNFNAVRIFESTWCFNRINTSSEGLRDYFQHFIDSNDGIIISEVVSWASLRTDGNPNNL